MKIEVKDINNKGFLTRSSEKVCVKLMKNCEDCNEDLSVTAGMFQGRSFSDTSNIETYKGGVCSNCTWERAHADGKDHFMESQASILNGLTTSEYQRRFGVAWNE